MTDAFSDLVMPIFKQVIDLMRDKLSWAEAADHQVIASLGHEEVKKLTRGWIEEADRRSKGDATLAYEFELARYGLVAWIDEVLTDSAWGQKVGWGSSNQGQEDDLYAVPGQLSRPSPVGRDRLEKDLYNSNDRAWQFYSKANDLSTAIGQSLCSADPLEAMLLCVALGFRGERGTTRTSSETGSSGPTPGSPRPSPSNPDRSPRRPPTPRKPALAPRQGPSLLLTVSTLGAITAVSTAIGVILSVYARYQSTQ